MQLEELVLRVPGDEFRIRFHTRLTVLSGIGMLERQALADSIVGALTGGSESTTLTYRDGLGRVVRAVTSGGRVVATYEDDGRPAPDLVGSVAPDAEALRALMLLNAADVGIGKASRATERPELAEARTMLRALAAQLEEAMAAADVAAGVRAELAEVEAALRDAEDGAARQRHARLVADLERVRAEAAALRSGAAGIEADRRLLATAAEARAQAERWQPVADRLADLERRFAGRDRLPADEVAAIAAYPDRVPAELPGLVADLEAARAERDALSRRLKDLAASRLPEPSSPTVSQLARAEQDALWEAHRRVDEAARRLQTAQVAMGGLGPADGTTIVAEIEEAHQAVDEAERDVAWGRRPGLLGTSLAAVAGLMATEVDRDLAALVLLAGAIVAFRFLLLPRWRLRRSTAREAVVLARANIPSHLAYQMRRVEAAVDPEARQRLDVATADHRSALAAWHQVAGPCLPGEATRLADEVRSYALALSSLGGAADEIEQVRQELTGRAEPAVQAARDAVLAAAAPFGVDDDPAVLDSVRERVPAGRLARLQAELDEVAAEASALAGALHDLLDGVGIDPGEPADRVQALERAVRLAEEREAARASSRPRAVVEDELARLEAEAGRQGAPDAVAVTPPDGPGAAATELRARAQELRARLDRTAATEADVERLADRHAAMERRVKALESTRSGPGDASLAATIADAEHEVIAHLTAARHRAAHGEQVPVLLDEPFVRIPAERKWELLDMLLRLAERVQLVYLTDDPYVTAWSRRRATDGSVLLLEPDPEPV